MDDLLGNIIAGIIQVVPLLAIPFILKGIVDGVPVLGNALNKGFNRASGMAAKQADKSGWAAERRAKYAAGKINGIGINRSADAQARRRTFGQFMGDRDRRYKKSIAGYEKSAENQYDKRVLGDIGRLEEAETQPATGNRLQRGVENAKLYGARKRVGAHERMEEEELRAKTTHAGLEDQRLAQVNNPNSTLGRLDLQRRGYEASGARSSAQTDARWKEATAAPEKGMENTPQTQALNAALGSAGLNREQLVRQAHETSGFAQAGSTADNRRVQDYSDTLTRTLNGGGSDADKSLLTIAGGSVSATGQTRAQAAAVEAGFKIFAQNTAANRSLLQKQMSDQQLKLIQSTTKNSFGEALDSNGQVIAAPNTILEKALRSHDMNEVLAARDEFMSQGQSGVISGLRTIENLEQEGAFKDRQEILTTLKRTQLSEHGKQTKENATFAVAWAQGADSLTVAKQKEGRYTSQTYGQLAGQATASLLAGVNNGGVSVVDAETILTDDKLRNQFDQEQVQILQMLKDHGPEAVVSTWNPDSGKLWVDEKATSTTPAPTYAAWAEKTRAAKEKPQATAPDPNAVPDSPKPTKNVRSVLPGQAEVPRPGSSTPVLKQYADKAGGVSRMSRDKFDKFQKALSNVPEQDRKDDNDDLKLLIEQTQAEVIRRNEEVDAINRESTENIERGAVGPQRFGDGSGVAPREVSERYTLEEMPTLMPADDDDEQPAPAPAPQPQTPQQPAQAQGPRTNGYPQNVTAQSVAEEMRQASNDFGSPLAGLGIDSTQNINSYSPETRDRIFAILRSYRQSLRNAQGSESGGPTSADLQAALRRDMEQAINNERLGNG